MGLTICQAHMSKLNALAELGDNECSSLTDSQMPELNTWLIL
jgi:hypothetical protein